MPVVYEIYADTTSGYLKVYKSNETSNSVVLAPRLKRGTNQASGLDFVMLPDNPAYNKLEELKSIIFVLRDGKYIFRGRVKDIKTDIFKQQSVSCEGDLAFLGDSIQSPNTFVVISEVGDTGKKIRQIQHDGNVTMTVAQYFQSVIASHNDQMTDPRKQFTVGTVSISKANQSEKFEVSSYTDTSSVISSDLVDVYGGIVQTRYVNDVPYIDWIEEYTDVGDQDIRYGVNLLELDQEQPNDDIWTMLLPIGKDKLTIEKVNNNSKYLINQTAVNKYGRILHYHKFDDAKTPADLLAKAQDYLSKHSKVYSDNLIVKAVDLKLIGEATGPLELGDKIKVVSSPHGINKTMACIEEEIDIQNPENSTYTIGTIMPPDDTKKSSMSSRHAAATRRAARTSVLTGDAIDGLQRDMDVVANNVNVNAKNIAINAEDIAVNAENIAINASNITLAAQTINVKASALSVQLGDVEDDVTSTIESTATGLRTAISSQMSGLTHAIELLPTGFSSTVTDSEGRITSEITRAENSITATFNDELYNETTGLATVLRGEISASESELRSDYRMDVYGPGGTRDNPTAGGLMAQYNSQISQTATAIQTSVSETLYGSDGKGGIVAEYRSIIRQTAGKITLAVWSNDNTRHDYSLSYISLTDNKIVLSSENIDLRGYVTADQLGVTDAKITNLMAGNIKGSKIWSDRFDAGVVKILDEGNLYMVTSSSNPATIRIGNSAGTSYSSVQLHDVSMNQVDVGGSGVRIGHILSTSTLSLGHSHAVSVGSDGTVTIGAAVNTDATGRSFRIADTKTYKDGVSAAANSVTINEIRRRRDENGDEIADSITTNSGHSYYKATVHTTAVASNGKIKNQDFDCDVLSVFTAGWNSVTVNSIGYQDGVDGPTYLTADKKFKIPLTAKASNNAYKNEEIRIDATEAWNAGKMSVLIDSITQYESATYSKTNMEYTLYIQAMASNDRYKKVSDLKINGVSAYNHGAENVTVDSVVRQTNSSGQQVADTYNSSTHNTTAHLIATASNGKTKTQDIVVYGTDAYNDGKDAIAVGDIYVDKPKLNSDRNLVIPIRAYTTVTGKSKSVSIARQDTYDVVYDNSYISSVVLNSNGSASVTIVSELGINSKSYTVPASKVTDNHPST